MAWIGREAFSRRLQHLDRDAFATFVADLWAASGWSTTVEDGVVHAMGADGKRRIAVLPPRRLADRWRSVDPPDDVDLVAWAGVGDEPPRGTPSVPVDDAEDLHDRLRFGVDPGDAGAMCQRHLGVPARGERWTATASVPDDAPLGRAVPAWTVVLVLLPAVLAGTILLAPSIGGHWSDGGNETVASAATVPEPTCDRVPSEVVETVANELLPPSEGSSGIQVLWAFTVVDTEQARYYSSFRSYYEGPRFADLRQADSIVVDDAVGYYEGNRAYVPVVASTAEGRSRYAFYLGRVDDPDDTGTCWRIRRIAPES